MRNARVLIIGFVILALAAASGCSGRKLTRSESDRLDAIAAKIAEAERIGAPDCIDWELLAKAKVGLERARHEMMESRSREPRYTERYVSEADKAATELLEKAKACVEAKKAKAAPPPPPAPPPAPAPAPAAPPPAPAAPAPAAPPPAPAPMVEEKPDLEPVYFDFDKSFIREDAKPALRKVADYLKKNKDAKIQVQGNCDERGTSEYNMALGDRRATSARKYLTGMGIDGNRISTISYGKERPVCTEQNETCWQKNRRGDFVLQK